ncbi:cation transporter [Candidatus Nitrosoglobus terrae]|uniref:Cation transporter n=1 Tax=Candidatus Nitrosoglobus terrae TaxID=1630141 RepID=A0A1Q2SN97_9GAMM|nr:CusA/CzcA family heavy metal efflux RND transporter [Candidatus Nitrosoglobus terrae]BAW80618.1 cation transporter [Candidatus Nitrosoglobus terrae]
MVASDQLTILQRIIGWCARNWLLTFIVTVAATLWGYRSLINASLDAMPDLSEVQVIVYTKWEGRSPDLIEDQITYPLATTLLSIPKVNYVRGQSMEGYSFLYLVFEEGTDIYWARSRVLEYLSTAQNKVPKEVQPTLGPDASSVGWVYQYALKDTSGHHNVAELRSLQDFKLRYALASVKGVAEVASVGGYEKEYQIDIDPNKLASFKIPLNRVIAAVRASNNQVGGRMIEVSGYEQSIRGRGYISSIEDLNKVVLKVSKNGTPVILDQVATVHLGPAFQSGQADLNGEGVTVGGIVVMRYGENALSVIAAVKQRLEELKANLPQGVEIVPVYDRSDLIKRATATLNHTLIEEMLIVSLIITLFLLHARSALVAIITLPIAVLLAFIPMYYQGLTANIMSLSGIAVAIGTMVDAAIAMIENVHQRLSLWQTQKLVGLASSPSSRTEVIISAMQEVGPSIFFALLIITISFIPILTLEGTEGRLFKPLAFTKSYSMFFAALLSITLIPALAVLVIKGAIHGDQSWLNRTLVAIYIRVVRLTVKFRWLVIIAAMMALITVVPMYRMLGTEFMPALNEGTLLYMPTTLPSISISEATRILQTMDRMLVKLPEIAQVFGKAGRSTSPTDSAPLSMFEIMIQPKPQSEWSQGMSWDQLIQKLDQTMQFPGMPNIWWMPIQTRTEMLATGIRSALGIKVFGPDLESIQKTAIEIENALQQDPRTKPYTRSAFAERTTGGYFLDFDISRDKAARFGLNIAEVQNIIVAAMGGEVISQTIEGRERYGILVRYGRPYRDHIQALKRALIFTATGAQIPISQVADIKFRTGPAMIRSEDAQLVGFVNIEVTDKIGIVDYVQNAKQVVADKVKIPDGYRLDWAGQFQYYTRAKASLAILVPLTLFLIFFMLYFHCKSLVETLIIMLALPFSLVGSVGILLWLQYRISVAVAVGMIAVAGLAVELGVLMLLYLNMAWSRYQAEGNLNTQSDLTNAIVEGAAKRLRPKLMTGLALFIGLIPIMEANGTGADVMKRIAAPMLGGIASSLLLVLIVFPAIFAIWKGKALPSSPKQQKPRSCHTV